LNQRIEKLIEQCTVQEFSDCTGGFETFDKAKFAELIVQDLIDSMIKRYGDDDELPIQEIKLFVKEHFGVDE
jgi:hypothetical protein